MKTYLCLTVANEDEVVSVEMIEEELIHVVEDHYAKQGLITHIGLPEPCHGQGLSPTN